MRADVRRSRTCTRLKPNLLRSGEPLGCARDPARAFLSETQIRTEGLFEDHTVLEHQQAIGEGAIIPSPAIGRFSQADTRRSLSNSVPPA